MSRLHVEDIFELTGRVGVIAGLIVNGTLRIGLSRRPGGDRLTLEITSIEFLDHVGMTRIGLLFKERLYADLLTERVP